MSGKFEDDEIFTGSEIPTSLAERLAAIRKRLKEKYNVNYMEVNGVDKDKKCILFNIDNKVWNDYLWKSKYIHLWPEMDKDDAFASLDKGKNILRYYDEGWTSQSRQVKISTDYHAELRANIIGEYHRNVYGIMFHNERTGNKVQFYITFYNHQPIGSLSKDVFLQLMNDLKSAEEILEPYVEYFKAHGNLQESPALSRAVKEHSFFLKF